MNDHLLDVDHIPVDLDDDVHGPVAPDLPRVLPNTHLEHFYHIVTAIFRQFAVDGSLSLVAETIRSRLGFADVRIGAVESGALVYHGSAFASGSADEAHGDALVPVRVLRTRHTVRFAAGDSTGSGACVPIANHGSALGVLSVTRDGPDLDYREVDLLEKIGAILGMVMARSRGRASELHHLDQLIRLQNLMARIISREDVTENVEDVLSEIATAFDYSAVGLGLLVGSEIQFFATYRSAMTGGTPAIRMAADSGVAGRAIRTAEPQFVEDVASDPDYQGFGEDTRQELCVPVRVDGEVVGVLDGHLNGNRTLVVDDLGVMLLLADSFGLVISNHRRLHEVKRRNLQLQLVESIVTMIAGTEMIHDSSLEIVREIADTFGFDLCSIGHIENERVVLESVARHPSYAVPTSLRDGIPLGMGVIGQVALTGEPEFVRDVSLRDGYIDFGWHAGSEICIPILLNGRVSGVLNVESVIERPLQDDDFEVLTIIANHIGIAMARDNLLASERESRLAMEAIQDVSSIVASTLDLGEALRLVVDTLAERFGYAYVGVGLIEGEYVRLQAANGFDVSHAVPVPLGADIVGTAAQSGTPIFLENVSHGSAYNGIREDATSRIAVPIRSSGQVVGVLDVLGTPERELNQNDLLLLQTFADHTGTVLNNARMYDEVRRLATVDSITGVPNHRQFQERLTQEFEQAERIAAPLSLLLIDLDNFKMVNDRYGHIAGDGVLSQVAQRLRSDLRGEDLLARYAGDEFVMLLPGVEGPQAVDVGMRLRDAARSEPFHLLDGTAVEISISVGVSTFPSGAKSRLDLLRTADEAMYIAKRQGRDSVHHADTRTG